MAATLLAIAGLAQANPLSFLSTSKSAAATTTQSFMTAGTATTTHSYDAYSQPSGFALNQATLLVQMGASSTASELRINIEYSHDNIDWFEDGGTLANNFATSSKPFDISQVNQFKLTFASSTPGGLSTVGDATTTRAILVKTPTRFMRAVFTLAAGSAGANVWSEWVPIKEASEK